MDTSQRPSILCSETGAESAAVASRTTPINKKPLPANSSTTHVQECRPDTMGCDTSAEYLSVLSRVPCDTQPFIFDGRELGEARTMVAPLLTKSKTLAIRLKHRLELMHNAGVCTRALPPALERCASSQDPATVFSCHRTRIQNQTFFTSDHGTFSSVMFQGMFTPPHHCRTIGHLSSDTKSNCSALQT